MPRARAGESRRGERGAGERESRRAGERLRWRGGERLRSRAGLRERERPINQQTNIYIYVHKMKKCSMMYIPLYNTKAKKYIA